MEVTLQNRHTMDKMTNIENLYSYSTVQYELIDHMLTMGIGAHIAALFFFLVVSRFVAPNYRIATALSGIVMVSAGLILYSQASQWTDLFSLNPSTGLYDRGEGTFTNGFRYVNWMVTIPCLITQLLIVLGIRGKQLASDATKLIIAAWGMIITGYIGQLYEVSDLGQLLLWGAISTVFFVYMNYIFGMRIFRSLSSMPPAAARVMRRVFGLMMFAWTLYPIAYLVPWLMPSAEGVVWRQAFFTVADVSSKVVYGIMITYIAIVRSAAEGYPEAVDVFRLPNTLLKFKVV